MTNPIMVDNYKNCLDITSKICYNYIGNRVTKIILLDWIKHDTLQSMPRKENNQHGMILFRGFMIKLTEVRNFKLFKLNINGKKVACYWDIEREEYQFFRCREKLEKSELKEMKHLILKQLKDQPYLNCPTATVNDYVPGIKVFDIVSSSIRFMFDKGTDSKGHPGVYIDRGIADENIEFRYYNQLRLIS